MHDNVQSWNVLFIPSRMRLLYSPHSTPIQFHFHYYWAYNVSKDLWTQPKRQKSTKHERIRTTTTIGCVFVCVLKLDKRQETDSDQRRRSKVYLCHLMCKWKESGDEEKRLFWWYIVCEMDLLTSVFIALLPLTSCHKSSLL